MDYKIIDREQYYRKGVYRHFTEDCKCSTSITARIDVTDLVAYSKRTQTRFYINFLYILCRVLNSREDYRMNYLWQTDGAIEETEINTHVTMSFKGIGKQRKRDGKHCCPCTTYKEIWNEQHILVADERYHGEAYAA